MGRWRARAAAASGFAAVPLGEWECCVPQLPFGGPNVLRCDFFPLVGVFLIS